MPQLAVVETVRLAWSLGMIGVWAAALGCSESEPGGPRAQVRDAAGFRIVSHDLDIATVPVYRTVRNHDLEIGSIDGPVEYAFSRIVYLALAPEGGLVVSDANSQEIRVLDADGRHWGTIGQRGEGPGEFVGAPSLAGTAGDTLYAFDVRLGLIPLDSG